MISSCAASHGLKMTLTICCHVPLNGHRTSNEFRLPMAYFQCQRQLFALLMPMGFGMATTTHQVVQTPQINAK